MRIKIKLRVLILNLFVVFLVSACADPQDAEQKPYLEFEGGGFVYNYRIAEADYGFVAKVVRKLPANSRVEAEFENPAGGEPYVVVQEAHYRTKKYYFRTPPVSGIQAGKDYQVELRVVDEVSGQAIARYQRSFHADLDQAILPEQAPVVGPGYHTNPALTSKPTDADG